MMSLFFPDRLPGIGGHRSLRRPSGDRRRRPLPQRDRKTRQETPENPARRGAARSDICRTRRYQERSRRPALPVNDAGRPGIGTPAPRPQDALAAGQEIFRGGRYRPQGGSALAASRSIAYGRRRSTTPSATARPCTRCGNSTTTVTFARPSFTLCARKKTARLRRGKSKSV
jgi:hypothetical protein